MTKALEVPTPLPSPVHFSLVTMADRTSDPVTVHGGTWELMVAFQRLQQVHREGRMEEREAACENYIHEVRRHGGDPRVHFQYTLGLLALGLSRRDPDRASVFERILEDHSAGIGVEDVELLFRRGLERLFGIALKPREGSMGDRLERARRFLGAHFQEPLRLEAVASRFGFSASSLGRRFKERYGTGFSSLLRDLRVEKAKELLREGRLSIEQISRECGFRNFHYFFEVFKKATGRTPQKYRNAPPVQPDKI